MYFKIFKPISWGKRPAERRSRLIQRFHKDRDLIRHEKEHEAFYSGIKQQAGANRSVCSCFLPPDGVPARPPRPAAFQRSCVLHRAFSYDPPAHSADRIPARTKKLPGRAAARRRFRLSKKSGTVKISQQIRNVLRNRKIGFYVPYFRSSLPILSLRGGRVRPTRQSLTNRFAIP